MKKISTFTKVSQRTLASLMATALIAGGTSVITPAVAQTAECAEAPTLRAENGDGTLVVENRNFQKVLTFSGTGFAERPADGFLGVKLNQNLLQWPTDQSAGDGFEQIDPNTLSLPASKIVNGEFTANVVLPDGLKDGQYVLTVLGGNDGGVQVAKRVVFNVNNGAADGHCGTIAEATQAAAQVTNVVAHPVAGRNVAKGDVIATVEVTGFPAGQNIKATFNGEELKTSGRVTAVNDAGTGTASFLFPSPTLRDGEHSIQVSAEGVEPVFATVNVFAAGRVGNNAAQGSTTTFDAAALPAGAKVTRVGTEGQNWLTSEQATVADDNGQVLIKNVKVPADAPFGAVVDFSFEVNGDTITRETTNKINASNDSVGVEGYDHAETKLTSGLYQSAVNDETGHLFVTRAIGVTGSSIYKLDAKTLDVVAENNSLHPDGSNVFAAYGVGLDNQRGLVWVTNTRQNTVSIYKQDDLSHVKTFPAGSTGHPRDVVVDESTGLAYVSAAGGSPSNVVDIYDATKDEKVGSITLDGFDRVMSLTFDKAAGTIYTVSLNTPKAARIDLHSNNAVTYYDLPADQVSRPSGIAYDPVNKNIFVASQGSGNTVVLNAETGELVKTIPTGASALNAAYNPKDQRVYITNRGGGTITVIDPKSLEVIANLPAGTNANHVSIGADGAIYAVNKAAVTEGENRYDNVHRYQLKATDPSTVPDPSTTPQPAPEEPGSSDSSSKIPSAVRVILAVLGIGGIIAGIAAALQHFGLIPPGLIRF